MSDREIGLALTCGLCCLWPLAWGVLGWWLRGQVLSDLLIWSRLPGAKPAGEHDL